ncbi:MAG: DUF4397 domain-containing protein [Rhodothermales bacterium]
MKKLYSFLPLSRASKILLACLALVLAATGVQAQTARVQVVHNSPYAAAAAVDVYINGSLTLDDFAFRSATPFVELPAGAEVTIDITTPDAADNSSPVFTKTIPAPGLTEGETYLLVAAGDPLGGMGNPAFDLFVYAPAREAAATAGNAEFLVFHGAPDAPVVDVSARGAGMLVDDIAFGEFSAGYLSVPPAVYEVDIELADNSAVAASFVADLSGAADAAIAVLASGFLAPPDSTDPAFGLLAVFADGTTALLPVNEPEPETARVQVVHNSPYAAAAVVDVYINDALALDDVAFRQATPYLTLPAGVPVKIDITGSTAADNSSPVFTTTLADGLAPNETYLVVAAGDPLGGMGNPAFDLFVYTPAREAAATAGNAEFLVFHGAPDAPVVDVSARGAGVLVDDIAFGEFSAGYLSVPPAVYEVDIELADNSAVAASFVADLSGAADAAVAVLASGFLAPPDSTDPGFGLLAVFADGTTALLPVNQPEGASLSLIDASTDSPIPGFDPIAEGAVLDLSALPIGLTVRANLTGDAGSVRFDLNDIEGIRVENEAPYALFGDVDGDYAAGRLPVGSHTLSATAFAEAQAGGAVLETASVSFTVVNSGNAVTGFTLVDAETDEDLGMLMPGDTLDASALPERVNLRAEVGDGVASVWFEIESIGYSRLENVTPFALFGDLSGDYLNGAFPVGSHTLVATPYDARRAQGSAGEALSVAFVVIDTAGKMAGVAGLSGHSEEAFDEVALAEEDGASVPTAFVLEANYPNPFNPVTTIAFTTPEAGPVRLAVYDLLGRVVRVLVDQPMAAGRMEVSFDAAGLPTGTYLYRIDTPAGSQVRKMLLVK